MFTKRIFSLVLFLFLAALITLAGCSQLQQGVIPTVEDSPTAGALSFNLADSTSEGKTQLVLKASSVEDFKGYSVTFSYDPALLQVTEITEGDFLASHGETFFYQDINEQAGTIQIDCALLGKDLSVSGTGILANLSFTSQKSGSAGLIFSQMKVRNVENQEMVLTKENFRF
jgi:autotransporter adhesin